MNIPKPAVEDDESPDIILRKFSQLFGVRAYVILNDTGIPVKYHGMDGGKALQYAALVSELAISARNFLNKKYITPNPPEIPENELVTLRIKTQKNEIMIAPDGDYMLVAVHDSRSPELVETKEEEKGAA